MMDAQLQMSPLNIHVLQQDSHEYIVRRDQYCDVLFRIQDINTVVILIAARECRARFQNLFFYSSNRIVFFGLIGIFN